MFYNLLRFTLLLLLLVTANTNIVDLYTRRNDLEIKYIIKNAQVFCDDIIVNVERLVYLYLK